MSTNNQKPFLEEISRTISCILVKTSNKFKIDVDPFNLENIPTFVTLYVLHLFDLGYERFA